MAAVGASKHGQATEVLSTVTTAQENPPQVPDRGWRIVAGPELDAIAISMRSLRRVLRSMQTI